MPLPPQSRPIPGLQNSALDIIKSALRLCNVLASGDNPSADEGNDALNVLNQMLDSWQIERLMIYTVNRMDVDSVGNSFVLVPGKQAYTVGVSGDFNIPRPPRIDYVSLIYLANPQQPLEIPLDMLTNEEWQAIPVKNIQSTIPLNCWNDGNFPLYTLSFYCTPSIVNQVVLYAWQALQYFPDLATKLTFPPGYLEAIRYSLAVRLAAEYGNVQLPPAIPILAVQAIAKIKSFNQPIVDLRCDAALVGNGGMYDWRSDSYVKR